MQEHGREEHLPRRLCSPAPRNLYRSLLMPDGLVLGTADRMSRRRAAAAVVQLRPL
jgi:hypothetical protein